MSNLWNKFRKDVGSLCRYVPVREFEYSVNISAKYRYLYVETPKVAYSTVKRILQRAELEDDSFSREDFEDTHNRKFSPLLSPAQVGPWDRYMENSSPYIFCFSRNPYSRILSAYLDKVVRNRPQKLAVLTALGMDVSKPGAEVAFLDFLKVVCAQPISNMDPHWRVQYYQTFQDGLTYDYIGSIDRFDDDLRNILSCVGIDCERYLYREYAHNTNASSLMSEYYCPDCIELVRNKFDIDFDYFGYSRDPWW